jgi:acetylornithine deacetylase/succinyl-diaminopimelate desuccinylase-like protein
VHNPVIDFRRRAAWIALIAVLLGGVPGHAAPDAPPIGEQTATLLVELIRIDTSNPPGNETPAARVMAARLAQAGVEAEVIESSPRRGNLWARLRGKGGGRPVILLSHLDVVPADAAAWREPPFAGIQRDGYVWGRGALDAKGVGAVQLMTLVSLARSGEPLDRDVILLATADEETGGRAGAGWIVEHRPDLLGDAEFLVTEGDHIHARPGGRRVVQVAVAEKTPCWVRLTARGPAGHGSTPPPDTAVTRLVAALDRIRGYRPPIQVVPAVEHYFAALATLEKDPLASHLADLRKALEDETFLADFTRNPRQNALVRNTITPTVLVGSAKTNVIPGEAHAELDCRLLPGQDPEDLLAKLRELVGTDQVSVDPLLSFPTSSSDPDSAFMRAVRSLAVHDLEGAPVVPSVIPGFTDSHYFRVHGIASYGFVPFVLGEEDQKTVHGVDERVSAANLGAAVQHLTTLLRTLSTNSSR